MPFPTRTPRPASPFATAPAATLGAISAAIAALLCAAAAPPARAQTDAGAALTPEAPASAAASDKALPAVTVNASADASARGLAPVRPGGQVARAARAGVLGTLDALDTPFSTTSYTNELIQDRHARSVGEVLQNDPSVRVARGFGNFQEAYFLRGFILNSDDTAYNGLYSLLPRQYIATELFERVELLRGASAFLGGASPGGSGIGGSINLLPKRAPAAPLTRATLGAASGGQTRWAADIARRFGPGAATGLRLNAARHSGASAVAGEAEQLALLALGLDWHSKDLRLSGDIGWQEHRLDGARPSVMLDAQATQLPAPPDSRSNYAQRWTRSSERAAFGTLRAERDLAAGSTAWAAAGARRSSEANSLTNLTLSDGASGAASYYRFDNARSDRVNTAEAGLRGSVPAGAGTSAGPGHEWVVAAAYFGAETRNAYAMDWRNPQASNLYGPVSSARPEFGTGTLYGGDLSAPLRTGSTRLTSLALGDTLALAHRRLLLTAGLRHQRLDLADYDYGTGAPTRRYTRSRNTPLLAAVYKISPAAHAPDQPGEPQNAALSLYANCVEGLSQGQTAPASAANRGEMLAPHVSRQKELGLKWDGGRIAASLALFSTSRPHAFVDAASNQFSERGQDRHRGLELALQGEIRRGLRLLGGLTGIDARQQSTGAPATDGRRVIGVPRLQANLGAEWDLPGLPALAIDARLLHTGASPANAANTLQAPAWQRLDLGARYLTEVQGRLLTLRARIDNLTDRNYWASAGGYPGRGYLVQGAPRTLSLSASVDF